MKLQTKTKFQIGKLETLIVITLKTLKKTFYSILKMVEYLEITIKIFINLKLINL